MGEAELFGVKAEMFWGNLPPDNQVDREPHECAYVVTHLQLCCVSVRVVTCRELKIVKSQAKTVAFSLRVRRPNSHVNPRRGSRIIVARSIVL